MPTREDILRFCDTPPPGGASPFVAGAGPDFHLELQEYDPSWPDAYASIAQRVRVALGFRALLVQHVGSTSVPGLAAKPVIDVDLVVADPDDERAYVPPLEAAGFALRLREPWWYRHRLLRLDQPRANLHVFGCDSPEPLRHRLFRDWLRISEQDRTLYAAVKRAAVQEATSRGEDVERYNARKSATVREIYARAFTAAGLLDGA